MSKQTETLGRLRAFVYEQFPLAQQRAIGDDDSLVTSGIMDSMGVLEVVTYLESEHPIILSDEDMLAGHFDTIASMARFVESKLADSPVLSTESG